MRRIDVPHGAMTSRYIDGSLAEPGDQIWTLRPDDIAAIKAALAEWQTWRVDAATEHIRDAGDAMADLLRPMVDES